MFIVRVWSRRLIRRHSYIPDLCTREGTGGWDYNNFCQLLHDAAVALGAAENGDGDSGGAAGGVDSDIGDDDSVGRGHRVAAGPTPRTNAECFAISREIAEAIKGSFAEIRAVGPDGCWSPRHGVPFDSRDEGSKCVG